MQVLLSAKHQFSLSSILFTDEIRVLLLRDYLTLLLCFILAFYNSEQNPSHSVTTTSTNCIGIQSGSLERAAVLAPLHDISSDNCSDKGGERMESDSDCDSQKTGGTGGSGGIDSSSKNEDSVHRVEGDTYGQFSHFLHYFHCYPDSDSCSFQESIKDEEQNSASDSVNSL